MPQKNFKVNSEIAILQSLTDRFLHLILFPTEACNFRCVYCYEKYKNGKMELDVVAGLKKFLSYRMAGLDHLVISWFGGEPLLAQEVIEDISTHIKSLINDSDKQVYTADMTTNGYLLSLPVFKKMIAFGIRNYQISFDGPPDIHNKKRLLADKSETFDKIWENIERTKSLKETFAITVRLHIDTESYPHIFSFIDKYAQTFKDDKRYELFFRPTSCLGGINDKNLPVMDSNEFNKATKNIGAYLRKLKISYTTMENVRSICYAAKLNCFAIRANGAINKCTVAMEEETNNVGFLHKDGSLAIRRKQLLRWARGLESNNEQELLCPLVNIEREP